MVQKKRQTYIWLGAIFRGVQKNSIMNDSPIISLIVFWHFWTSLNNILLPCVVFSLIYKETPFTISKYYDVLIRVCEKAHNARSFHWGQRPKCQFPTRTSIVASENGIRYCPHRNQNICHPSLQRRAEPKESKELWKEIGHAAKDRRL